MGILEQFRRAGGEDPYGNRPRPRRSGVRITAPIDGILTNIDIDPDQWDTDRAALAHHIRLIRNDLDRLAELAATDAADLQTHPQDAARAIARDLHDRAAQLTETTDQ